LVLGDALFTDSPSVILYILSPMTLGTYILASAVQAPSYSCDQKDNQGDPKADCESYQRK